MLLLSGQSCALSVSSGELAERRGYEGTEELLITIAGGSDD
jgi:hypothetical protein